MIVTAQTDTVDLVAGLEAGADDYVTKPGGHQGAGGAHTALLRRVQLQESPPTRPVQFGDIWDPPGAGCRPEGRSSRWRSPRPSSCCCASSPSTPAWCSRDQLLERVWGYDYLGDSRLVDAHIRRLRVKIEDQPDEPTLILTVRGIGYRLQMADPDRSTGRARSPRVSGFLVSS